MTLLRSLSTFLIAAGLSASALGQFEVAQPAVLSGPRIVSGGEVVMQEQPSGEKPSEDEKPEESASDEKKAGEEKPDDSKDSDAEPKQITRPTEPPRTPDPRELQVKPDENGRVPFNFHGQPWPDVLQWLANVGNYSLDWQELPGGYLNLTTQRSYALPEARDLINRHLQARGFALLLSGEVLSVVKLESVDPSLVPKVTELDLYDRQPHDLVKVAFELPETMDAAKAVEDFQKALNKSAKLIPLPSTRRILAIDTVANLRLVSQLLNQERLAEEGRELPQRYVLQYARAEKVINTLYVVLGMDPASQPSQMELQIQMQKMQLLQQMQQSGKDVGKLLNKEGPKVFLAFNRQENSVLANAPPREMKIIARTVKILDIPPAGMGEEERPTGGGGKRFAKTYELENVQPDSLLLTLEEIGDLDPLTDLRADRQAKLLFVRGAERDHIKVQELIDQLTTGGLRFEVFQLRRHPADAVAGTVMALFGQEEEDDSNNDNSYFYGWYGMPGQQQKEEEPEIRIDADIENNRLLVYGTDEHIQQVRNLLEQLGELGGRQQAGEPGMRVYEPLDPSTTIELLEKLREAWPAISGGSELILQTPIEAEQDQTLEAPQDRSASSSAITAGRFHLLTDEQPANSHGVNKGDVGNAELTAKAPPVAITVTPDGRIVLMSDDSAALSRAEDLLNTLAPKDEQFHEFHVENTDAYYIWFDLKDYFEDELADDDKEVVRDWYGRLREFGKDKPGMSLAQRRKLRFLWITQTNSIIVANATPEQLDTIDKLIKIWDQPPREDDIRNRRTGMVKVVHSSPTKIAAALKEVYRDLLSSRDKEFETEDERGGSGYTAAKTTQVEFAGVDQSGGPVSQTKPIKVKFDGALSIGVDEASGMLLISAQTDIYDGVVNMVRLLDEEARADHTVRVVRVNSASVDSINQALSNTFGRTWVAGQPEQSAQQRDYRGRDQRDRRRDRRRRN